MSDKLTIMSLDNEEMNLQLFEINFKRKYELLTTESRSSVINLLEKYSESKLQWVIWNACKDRYRIYSKSKSKIPDI